MKETSSGLRLLAILGKGRGILIARRIADQTQQKEDNLPPMEIV
jgi:hypothetical protein